MSESELHVEPGHYFSPIPSSGDFAFADDFRDQKNLSGISLNRSQQFELARVFATSYQTVETFFRAQGGKFVTSNSWFFGSDAYTLVLMLIQHAPKNIIEIGSGFSTALLEDVDRYFFQGRTKILSIDPNPERVHELNLDVSLFEGPVQKCAPLIFKTLNAGDVLMIDSSHVLKSGSDVNYIFNEILPTLNKGVKIHIHDIFYPFEYPTAWLQKKVAFNEAYALSLLLRDSQKFTIIYWNDFLETLEREWFQDNMPGCLNSRFKTGGIWLEVL